MQSKHKLIRKKFGSNPDYQPDTCNQPGTNYFTMKRKTLKDIADYSIIIAIARQQEM